MKENKLWTSMDELGYQVGNSHGEWQRTLRPEQKKRSVPVVRYIKPECQKKHIKKSGK